MAHFENVEHLTNIVSFKTKFEMKKNIFYLMLMLLTSVLTFTSCDNDSSAGYTRITYYPVLSMQGDETMYIDKGTTFTDPGCTAELNGEDVTSQIVTKGTVNTAKSGVYNLSYSVANEDGFSATASRTVIVTDPADATEGVFTSDANSYRDYNGANTPFGSNFEVIIINNGDGTYHVEDLLGGWYSQRAGYGTTYNMDGTISMDSEGNLTLISSLIGGWNDGLVDFSGKFDAATGTYTWDAEYVQEMKFHVVLNK